MEVVRVNAVWCSSCIVTYKSWKEIQMNYPNNIYKELDYDVDSSEVKNLNIGNILPVHIVFDEHGNEKVRVIGEQSKRKFMKELSKYLDK